MTSPTFVIARVHRPDPARGGRVPLVHVDAYRLGRPTPAEVDDLDLDAPGRRRSPLVEWGEGMVEQLADAHLTVRIDRRDDDDARGRRSSGVGADWAERIAAWTRERSPPTAIRPIERRDRVLPCCCRARFG